MKHPKPSPKAAKEEDPEKVEWEERAIAMESGTKHGYGAQKTFRIEWVARMLVDGKSSAQICVILGEKWGRAPRTIQNYVGDAWRLLEKRQEQSLNMLRGKNLARLDTVFRMAKEAHNLGAMLDTIKVTNVQQGLNATAQRSLALPGADEEPLMGIVELPDNGRGGNQGGPGVIITSTVESPPDGESV